MPEDSNQAPREAAKHPVALFAAIAFATMLLPLNSTMVAVALPAIGTEFATTPATLTHLLVTSYLIVAIIGQNPGGKAGDLWGHDRLLAIGRWVFAAGALIALAPFLPSLMLARILMAAGGSLMLPAGLALLRIHIPENRRPRAYGGIAAVMSGAAALGPLIGGTVTEEFGWASVFWVNLPLLAASFLLHRAAVPAKLRRQFQRRPGQRFDAVGSIFITVMLVSWVVATRVTGAAAFILLVCGAMALAAFIFWEMRVADPVLKLSLFRRPAFVGGNAVTAFLNLGMYALLFQIPFVIRGLFGLTPAEVGLFLMAMTGSMVLISPFGGLAAERFGPKITVFCGGTISVIGMVLFANAIGSESLTVAPMGLALIGLGLGLNFGPAQASLMSAVDPGDSGMAAGANAMIRYFGGVIGIAILGMLLSDPDHEAMQSAAATGFWILGGSFALSALAGLLLPGRNGPRPKS